LVSLNNQPMISALGGTGLAISAFSEHIPEAVKYAAFTSSSATQQSIFVDNGGQPGHLKAWENNHANELTHQYFKNTLPALERAYLRPRYFGHMHFQDHGGDVVRNYLMNGGNEESVLEELNEQYARSLNSHIA